MSIHDEPDERASNEEEAKSRAYRRIADALERDDIDELAVALGQVPDPGVARAGQRWRPTDKPRRP
jgi:hypothetical protein